MTDDLKIPCPECNRDLWVTIEDVAKERKVRCPSGHVVALKDENGAFRKVQKSLDDLERTIRRLSD